MNDATFAVGMMVGELLMLGLYVGAQAYARRLARARERDATHRAVRAAFERVAKNQRSYPRGRNLDTPPSDEIALGMMNTLLFVRRVSLTVTK